MSHTNVDSFDAKFHIAKDQFDAVLRAICALPEEVWGCARAPEGDERESLATVLDWMGLAPLTDDETGDLCGLGLLDYEVFWSFPAKLKALTRAIAPFVTHGGYINVEIEGDQEGTYNFTNGAVTWHDESREATEKRLKLALAQALDHATAQNAEVHHLLGLLDRAVDVILGQGGVAAVDRKWAQVAIASIDIDRKRAEEVRAALTKLKED